MNLLVSKLTRLGRQPVTYFGDVRLYLDTPAGQPDWGLRAGVTLLYPR